MSRAFVKEDVDPPERSGRTRSASGLPPGAVNYITAAGAQHWRDELKRRQTDRTANRDRIAELEELIRSFTVVDLPDDQGSIAFGAKVTVRDVNGAMQAYRIVGVDELEFYPDAVSWISPIGKALLAAEVGDRLTLADAKVEVVKVEYPID